MRVSVLLWFKGVDYLKYAWKNLIRIFQNDRLIACLAILCIVASVIIMHFGYGLYQNFNALLEGEKNCMSELQIKINNPQAVTKAELVACIREFSYSTDDNICIISGFPDVQLDTKDSDAAEQEFGDRLYVPTVCYFSVNRGEITSSAYFKKLHENQGTISGEYFTDAVFAEGRKVALMDSGKFKSHSANDKDAVKFICEQLCIPNENAPEGYDIQIAGERYAVIGSFSFGQAILPVTALDDAVTFSAMLFFTFGNDTETSFVTREQYNDIRNHMQAHFGDAVTVPDIPLPDLDLQRLYRTVIMIAGLIAVIAAFNFTQLYLYILEKRRKRIAVMRICGCTRRSAAEIFLAECLMLILPVYLLSLLAFRFGILPLCSKMFPFMADSFSDSIYLALFVIFLTVSLTELLVMILRFLAGKDLVGKERGR